MRVCVCVWPRPVRQLSLSLSVQLPLPLRAVGLQASGPQRFRGRELAVLVLLRPVTHFLGGIFFGFALVRRTNRLGKCEVFHDGVKKLLKKPHPDIRSSWSFSIQLYQPLLAK